MGSLTHLPSALFTIISPGGFKILEVLVTAAEELNLDLVITSACDGLHSGPDDPHHLGRAYDVRSHDFTPELKVQVLKTIMLGLGDTTGLEGAPNFSQTTEKFFGWLENPGTPNEHFHVQVRRGVEFP